MKTPAIISLAFAFILLWQSPLMAIGSQDTKKAFSLKDRLANIQLKLEEAFIKEVEAGYDAYDNREYAKAFDYLLAPAIEGNVWAQKLIGDMYAKGDGVPYDWCFAHIWWEKAARQGHQDAAFMMAEQFLSKGVKPNPELAYRWAIFARYLGHPRGQDEVEYIGSFLPDLQRTSIELDMKDWDPAKLPPTEYFFFDNDALSSPEARERVDQRTGVEPCR